MSPFSVFAVLYMTAFLLELTEGWEHPRFTLVFLLGVVIIVLTGITRITFLFFLTLSTAFFLFSDFPDVANHVNLIIFCNIVMIVAIVYSFVRYRDFATDDDYYEMIRPVLG